MVTYGYDIARLARKQAELGLTNQEVARLAHIHPSTVKNVMSGATRKGPTVKAIATALGVEMADLVVAEDEVARG